MTVLVEPLSPEHLPAVREMLEADGLLAEDSRFRRYWLDFIEAPERANEVVVVALSDDRLVGMALASRRAYGSDGARLVFGWVVDDHLRRGIGTTLKREMGTRLAALGIPRQIVSIGDGAEDARAFLEAVGFTEDTVSLVMEAADRPRPFERPPGIRCVRYTGGDSRLNDGLADLQNWAFANDPIVPVVVGEQVEDILAAGGCWMMVAVEEATGKVVGYSECADDGFFTAIAVARRYWGTGLADWIAEEATSRYRELGIAKPWSLVRMENRASIALHERAGWQRAGTRTFFSAPTGAS